MAKVMMNATRLEPMNCRVLKSAELDHRRRHPELDRDERRQRQRTADSRERIGAEVQPQLLPSIRARTIAVRPVVSATTPG